MGGELNRLTKMGCEGHGWRVKKEERLMGGEVDRWRGNWEVRYLRRVVNTWRSKCVGSGSAQV